MKKPPSVEAASFKLKLCRDSRPHTIGYLYSYYNIFLLLSICLPTQNLRQHLNAATDILS